MEDLKKQLDKLRQAVGSAVNQLKIDDNAAQLKSLQEQSQNADFWNDSQSAQDTMKQISKLEAKINPWIELQSALNDLQEMLDLEDASLQVELINQLQNCQKTFEDLKAQLKLSGPYDDYDAIISIYAGAGGTDAQDWTQILLRMYLRFFEKAGYKVTTIDQSAGEEAGIKSVTIEVSGSFVYGKLKGEHGVHRLVRLSPFNADNLRQTSFAKVEVMPKIAKPDDLQIDEKDLKIDVFRSGGKGGQSVNTTDSAVRITHIPTGITVSIQNERSQQQNKELAMTIVGSRLAQLQQEQHQQKVSDLKGPNMSAEWGNQIRSYVLHPYKQVKDLRTNYTTSDTDGVLDGNLEPIIDAYLDHDL